MTDKDRPQLPPPAWYSLEDVAQRWGCKIEQVIHYGETGMLRISARSRNWFKVRWNKDVDKMGPNAPRTNPNHRLIGITPNFLSLLIEEDVPLSLSLACKTVKNDEDDYCLVSGTTPDSAPPSLSVRDLVIVRDELDRFEREYRIGAHAGELPKSKPELGERERQTMLVLIGAMLETIMDKGLFKSQAALVDYLVEEYDLSKRTTDGKLSEAKKALQQK
ncbi:MAG: hypothetical protein AB7E10_09835 [Burkholderiaceae bacterium]